MRTIHVLQAGRDYFIDGIFWGDDAEGVMLYLSAKGVSPDEIASLRFNCENEITPLRRRLSVLEPSCMRYGVPCPHRLQSPGHSSHCSCSRALRQRRKQLKDCLRTPVLDTSCTSASSPGYRRGGRRRLSASGHNCRCRRDHAHRPRNMSLTFGCPRTRAPGTCCTNASCLGP